MMLTYKYRLKGKRVVRRLQRFAWAANQVWNFCVATQRETQRRWRHGSPIRWLSAFDLTALAKGTSRALNIHAQSVQSVCDQFVKSRDQHRVCPRFRRSAGARRSLSWIPFQKQSRQVNGNAIIYLGDTFRFFGGNRPLPATAKGGCFIEDARGRWYVCFHVEVEERVTGTETVGVDLGLKTLATCSDGVKINNITPLRHYAEKLAIAQRASNRVRVRALHAKIVNVRRDYLHKASTRLARSNKFIVVGDVSSSKLAKTRLSKSVLDAGWTIFRNMLRYKASRHGALLLEVNERLTTQTCSACGNSASPSRPRGIAGLGIREWECASCGVHHDRDVNAAKNILALGLSAQSRGDESRNPVKTGGLAANRISTKTNVRNRKPKHEN